MKKPPVIVLAGIRYDFLRQRHQILATLFARAGYPTVFVETTGLSNPRLDRGTFAKIAARLQRSGGKGRKPPDEPRLTVYSPLAAPPTHGIFRWINAKLFAPRMVRDLEAIAGPEPVVIAYPPTRTTLDVISGLKPQLVLYDCSDDYDSFPRTPQDIAATERELLRRADLVSCTSAALLKKVKPSRPDAFLSGPGVNYERFAALRDVRTGEEVRTVCFFGHLSRERIDFSTIRAIARAGFEVRLVGGLGWIDKAILKLLGVDYRGEVSHDELPEILRGVDAFILPYRVNALTKGISPAKTFECLATGKPIVSSPIPAMKELDEHVYLAESAEDFVKILRELEELETPEKAGARMELARRNSWDARFAALEERLWRKL